LAFRNEEALLAQAADPETYNDHFIFPEKIRLNLEYMRDLSLLNDLRCLLETILKVLPKFGSASESDSSGCAWGEGKQNHEQRQNANDADSKETRPRSRRA